MKELYHDKETLFTVYFDEAKQKHFIEVTCGTIGWFEVMVELSNEEVESFKKDPTNLRQLRYEIFSNPEKYATKREGTIL